MYALVHSLVASRFRLIHGKKAPASFSKPLGIAAVLVGKALEYTPWSCCCIKFKESTMVSPPRRILIVDDEENVCHALRRSLRKEGYELFFGNEPAQGLDLLKKQPVDMVISDHLMPNMTGLEFLKIVRERYPDAMRLMLTGHADMQTAIDAINQGAIYRFLTKPWDDTELKVTLFLAFEQLDMERENRKLLSMVRRQYDMLKGLEAENPGIAHITKDAQGFILIDDESPGEIPVEVKS
jgi:two-component system, probable response regulator PhcQ